MAEKVLLKDKKNNVILPITRGELVLDSSGEMALHSEEFLASTSKPGLMSSSDKANLDRIAEETVDDELDINSSNPVLNKVITQIINSIREKYLKSVSVENNKLTITDQSDKSVDFFGSIYSIVTNTTDGLVPKFDSFDGTIDDQSKDWILTNHNGNLGWYKLPTSTFIQNITSLYIGDALSNGNTSTANGSTYFKLFENSELTHKYKIQGTGNTAVSSDDDGNLTIYSPTTLSWGNITGTPTEFKPESHIHPSNQITTLTGYSKPNTSSALSTTDTLNQALGKLEYKADLGENAYNWYVSITGTDTDNVINKWSEIVDFVANFKETPNLATYLSNNYLAKSGGTMTGVITLTSGTSAAYKKTALSFIKKSDKSEQARIGTSSDNGLGLYAKGTIYIRPNVDFSSSNNGLVISNNLFTYNGTAVSLSGHTHSKSDITDFDHNHDNRYYTETEVNNLLANKSNTDHTHDNYLPSYNMMNSAYAYIPTYDGETGWHRIATIVGSRGYGSYILYLCGNWHYASNTNAIIHIDTMHTTAQLTQVSGIVGYINKIRLVNVTGNKYYVDVHINYTGANSPGNVYCYFLGNGSIETRTSAEKITTAVTASAELTLVTGGCAHFSELALQVPWAGITNKPSTFTPESHSHNILETYFKFVKSDVTEDAVNLSTSATAHTMTFYRNGISIPYQMNNVNDGGLLRVRGTTENNVIYEMATWDDKGAGETILFNYYPTTSAATPTHSVSVPKKSGTIALISDIPTSLPANGGNADTVGELSASLFYQLKSLRSNTDSIYNLRWNYGTYDKCDYNGTYKDEYPTCYGAYLALAYKDRNIGALMFFDTPANNALGHIYVRTRGAGDSNTTYSGWGTLAYLTDNVASATKLSNFYSLRPSSLKPAIIGDGSMYQFKSTSTANPLDDDPGDGHILHFEWDNTNGYSSQLYIRDYDGLLKTRGMNGANNWGAWKEVVYQGGTFTGNVNGTLTGSVIGDVTGNVTGTASLALLLQSRGKMTGNFLTGSNKFSDTGLSLVEAHSSFVTGGPASYGNVLLIKGKDSQGCGELFLEWTGSTAPGNLYYRSLRDVGNTNWSNWITLLSNYNYNNLLPVKLVNGLSYWDMISKGYLRNDYVDAKYPVEDYLKALCLLLINSYKGYACVGSIRPSTAGSYICYVYDCSINTTTGLPEYMVGTAFLFGGGQVYFGTSSGVWYYRYTLTSANYNSWVPSKTGTGASGTWGISITGNASSATKLTYSAGSAAIPIYFSDGKPVACTPASIFSDLSNDGNNISMTVAGQNRKLTVAYALNADKLDNIDSTGFLRYYNSNAAPSDVNIVNIPSYVWTVSTTGGTITNAKKPAGVDNAWGVIHLHTHPGNYATQLGFGGTTNRMYMRNAYNNNTFGDWKSLAFTSDLDKYVPKNYNNIAYSDLIAYYTGGTKPDYYRIVLPDNVLSIWNMLTIELTINQNYALGYVGKILIYCLNNGSNIFSNFKASCLGTLTNDIKIYGSNGKYIYINGCLSYSTISIDKILVGDSATRQDQSNITIDIVSGLPSSYQTAQMIYNVDSSNIGRLSVNSATKLQTPRTIWGQSFDGSANVSGDMTGVGIINTIFNLKTQSGNASLYLETVTATTDYAHLFVNNKNDDKSNKSRPLVLQNGYGNVGIGIANPTQKLEVNGNIKATSFIGNLNGNATSASKWATPRTITLTGSVTGSASIDGSTAVSLETTTNKLNITGFSNYGLSYYQTSSSFDGSSEGWAHYIISNHGDGASYYHYTIRLPFWGIPQYKRLCGSTSNVTEWFNFITSENIGSQSVNYANSAGSSDSAQKLLVLDVRSATRLPNYFEEKKVTAWFNNTGTPTSDWYSGIHVKGWSSTYASWELCSYSSTGTANNYDLYFRNGNNSSWGSWKTIIDSANYESIIVGKSGTGNSDFTDGTQLLTSYASDSGFSTSNLTNKIYKRKASSMYNYIKTKAASDSDFTVGTATKLKTARTLWGKSFDGSANVSGDMSSVGQITFSNLSGSNGRALLYLKMADNDYFRIYVGGTGSNSGYAEIATADDGNEPIYVRLYTGTFSTVKRTLTLLDASGNASFPGAVYASLGFYESSDETLKNILNPVKVNLDDLSKLRKVYYLWKNNPEEGCQLGMIAQDIQRLYPELVYMDKKTGLLSLAYDRLSVIALEAIDVLYKDYRKLKERVDKLDKLLINNIH